MAAGGAADGAAEEELGAEEGVPDFLLDFVAFVGGALRFRGLGVERAGLRDSLLEDIFADWVRTRPVEEVVVVRGGGWGMADMAVVVGCSGGGGGGRGKVRRLSSYSVAVIA